MTRLLGQQFIVDQYAKIEQERLNWVKTHQTEIRAELYQGLTDALRTDDVAHTGVNIILPSSFTGGPRYMRVNYADAMAIVAELGMYNSHLLLNNIVCRQT